MSPSGNGPPGEPPSASIASDDNIVWLSAEEAKRREALKRGPKVLVARQWQDLRLPPRDYLMGEVLCSTSRWLVFGDTGIGKTLFGLMLAGAIAAGDGFLNWPGSQQPRRVVYLDGEMPAETMQERMKLATAQYGEDIELYAANRDIEEWPPLNDKRGVSWLGQVLRAYQPQLVVFDSIMSLVGGIMGEEESWQPMRQFVRWLSARQIAQIWLHHTGHDSAHSYGTKTREWEMDSVLALRRLEEQDNAAAEPELTRATMEFTKARLRTPENRAQFRPQTITFDDERGQWIADLESPAFVPRKRGAQRSQSGANELAPLIVKAYDALCLDGQAQRSLDLNGNPELKVKVDVLRAWLMANGQLDHDDGKLTATARTWFHRAKLTITNETSGRFREEKGEIWRCQK
ncbi:MAG TPA: AAA family ATPase [Rhizomicrobium sp.]